MTDELVLPGLVYRDSIYRNSPDCEIDFRIECNFRGFIQDCIEYHGLVECHVFKEPEIISHDMLIAMIHGLLEFPDYSFSMECNIKSRGRFPIYATLGDNYNPSITRMVYHHAVFEDDPELRLIVNDQVRFKRIKEGLHGL